MRVFQLENNSLIHVDGAVFIRIINKKYYAFTFSNAGRILDDIEIERYFKDIFREEAIYIDSIKRSDGKFYDLYYSLLDDSILAVYGDESNQYESGVMQNEKFFIYRQRLQEWIDALHLIGINK